MKRAQSESYEANISYRVRLTTPLVEQEMWVVETLPHSCGHTVGMGRQATQSMNPYIEWHQLTWELKRWENDMPLVPTFDRWGLSKILWMWDDPLRSSALTGSVSDCNGSQGGIGSCDGVWCAIWSPSWEESSCYLVSTPNQKNTVGWRESLPVASNNKLTKGSRTGVIKETPLHWRITPHLVSAFRWMHLYWIGI